MGKTMKEEDISKMAFAEIIKGVERCRRKLKDLGVDCRIEFPDSVIVNEQMYIFISTRGVTLKILDQTFS
jgi:hypothetical protein